MVVVIEPAVNSSSLDFLTSPSIGTADRRTHATDLSAIPETELSVEDDRRIISRAEEITAGTASDPAVSPDGRVFQWQPAFTEALEIAAGELELPIDRDADVRRLTLIHMGFPAKPIRRIEPTSGPACRTVYVDGNTGQTFDLMTADGRRTYAASYCRRFGTDPPWMQPKPAPRPPRRPRPAGQPDVVGTSLDRISLRDTITQELGPPDRYGKWCCPFHPQNLGKAVLFNVS